MGGGDAELAELIPGAVTDGCPAFADGCPYGKNDEIAEWMKENRSDAIGACPAFRAGCPFTEAGDLAKLQAKLSALPPSHAGEDVAPGTPHEVLMDMLKTVHKASQSMKKTVGADCPVFQEACPFKNCTSSGTPLAAELEWRSWGLWIGGSEEGQAETVQDEGLAGKLKEGTKEAHQAAETVHFVKEFVKCRVSRQIYAQFVVNLYHIYQALEEALEANCEHHLIESLHFPDELERTSALEDDAAYFLGENWKNETLPSKTTREYVNRIRQVQIESPELLIPHAYTRYLGDLSGGQVLRKAAIRGMKLPDDGSGVRFYIFKRIPDFKSFKHMYRARMDSLQAASATADRMVEEANYAFFLNTRIFQELDSLAGFEAEPVPPPPSAPAKSHAEAAARAAAAGCPFASLAAQGMTMPDGHPGTSTSPEHTDAMDSKEHGANKAGWRFASTAAAVLALSAGLRAMWT
mmetsp:Transcript_43135/g.100553  ORF Transcript_43135/g.100553 Transcript_43135/m.100553 type:complete len:464 (+) Transcript_43135:51-1442(+)